MPPCRDIFPIPSASIRTGRRNRGRSPFPGEPTQAPHTRRQDRLPCPASAERCPPRLDIHRIHPSSPASKPFGRSRIASLWDNAGCSRLHRPSLPPPRWSSQFPYFSDRVGIDWLGKNDAHIAHEPIHRPSSGLRTLVEFRGPYDIRLWLLNRGATSGPGRAIVAASQRRAAILGQILRGYSSRGVVYLCPARFGQHTMVQVAFLNLPVTALSASICSAHKARCARRLA